MAVVASFTFVKTSGSFLNPPFTVAYTDTSTGGANKFMWDFGDGSSSASQHPSHTYTEVGPFTVTLRAILTSGGTTIVAPTWSDAYRTRNQLTNFSTPEAAYAAWLTMPWTNFDNPGGFRPAYDMGRVSAGYSIQNYESSIEIDLTAYSPASYISWLNKRDPQGGGDIRDGNPSADIRGGQSINPLTNSYVFYTDISEFVGLDTMSAAVTDLDYALPDTTGMLPGNASGWELSLEGRVQGYSSQDTVQATVPGPLTVDFSGTPRTGNGSIDTTFTALSAPAYSISSRVWESNDVEFSTDEFPTETFP